jgi:Holliday junction DNA helicase RuvA
MIGRLRGVLAVKSPPDLLIEVGGVGYELQASLSTFDHLPDVGEAVALFTHFTVREDAQLLYGFFHERERLAFRQLIKVSGVGPKLALTILSGMEVNLFIQCIEKGEISALVRLPGVGKKTAERLMVEMRGKLSDDISLEIPQLNKTIASPRHIQDEAVRALVALGYSQAEATQALKAVPQDVITVEQKLRMALQSLAKAF